MRGCRAFTGGEVGRVKGAFSGKYEFRDRALFFFGCTTGFRISEILSVTRGDLIDRDGSLFESVTVKKANMKGKLYSRTIYVNRKAREHISAWLDMQAHMGYMMSGQHVFMRHGGGRMDRKYAWKILKAAYRKAGLPSKGYGTHSMRKTFADRIFDKFPGKDALMKAQIALGHRRIDSTISYIAFKTDDVPDAILGLEIES
jgi:integrase